MRVDSPAEVVSLPSIPLIALIGGIGSGKSAIGRMFAELGAVVLEADQFGHEALRQPAIRANVLARWPGVADEHSEVSRRKLGAIVFADATERVVLEQMVFPWIERRIREEVLRARAIPGVPLIVLDAAVLLEAGWDHYCDAIVFVNTPREQRLERLRTQRQWTEQEVAARENAQLALAAKQARADVILDNAGTLDETRLRVQQIFDQLRDMRAQGDQAPSSFRGGPESSFTLSA